MIHVVFRHRAAPGTEATFPSSWEQLKTKMLGHARGLERATLFQSAHDPSEFVWVTSWASLEDWQAYWREGVPDPEADLARSELLVLVKTLARTEKSAARKRRTRPRPSGRRKD